MMFNDLEELGVGMLGYAFMGKAHTNGYKKLPYYYEPDPPAIPKLKGICGRTEDSVREAQQRFGYDYSTTDWRQLVEDDKVDIFDNTAPNNVHAEPCIAALNNGKHTIVEKPLALNLQEAKDMYEAAEEASQKGVKSMVAFSNRFAPAILLAKRLIEEGEIGDIYHFRASFLQDWLVDPNFPLSWRLQEDLAGSGVHGDLNAHSIDMARFLVGEIEEVSGWTNTFVEERPMPAESSGLSGEASDETGEVTVDDAALAWLRFENGAMGNLEASRFSTGSKSVWRIEVHGSKGAFRFDLTKNNELKFFSREDSAHAQGFRKIIATEADQHEFIEHWWPPGHMLGWEAHHCNAIFHFVDCIANDKPISPYGATFYDGLRCQEILKGCLESSNQGGKWVDVQKTKRN